MRRRRRTRELGCERLETRRLLATVSQLPVAMWIEGDNGDSGYYSGIVDYATSAQQPLTAAKLVLRLADPASSDPSISQNFQLNAKSALISTILTLDAKGFAGEIALVPDFTSGGHVWNWSPAGQQFTAEWQKAFYWAHEANTILATSGSKNTFISEITIEAEASGIPADEDTLNAIRAYQATWWPELDGSPQFVGTGLAHGYTNLAQMAGWTQGAGAADRLLDAAYCELYNMTESAGGTTYVDAYAAGVTLTNPQPQAPTTIYSAARNVADPAAMIFGTPTDATAASTFGYFVGKHTSGGIMPADLSRTYLIFSTEHASQGLGLIDAFGTWDAPVAGPGAGVDEFIEFCRKFTDPSDPAGFMPFWSQGSQQPVTTPPNICVFQYQFLPQTWQATPAGLPTASPPTLEDLVLWDYRECGSDATSLATYHTWLLGYLADHPPQRLVLYVSDPAVVQNSFYEPTAAPAFDAKGNPTNFVGFLQKAGAIGGGRGVNATPRVPIEILIDRLSFSKPAPVPTGWQPVPTGTPAELTLPDDWANLPRAFSWLATLRANTAVPAGLIPRLTIDPELSKGATGLTGDYAYQHIACWLDWAKRTDGYPADLGIGMALEVDSSVFAKVNTMTFPAVLNPTNGMPVLEKSWLDFDGSRFLDKDNPAAVYPIYRDPTITDPILSMAYMETYVGGAPNASSYYRWMNDVSGTTVTPQSPAKAAADLQKSLLQRPYATGDGTIAVQSLVATGTGTNFEQLVQYDAITATADPTSYWKIQDEIPGGTTLTLKGSGADVTNSPWLFTELAMDWQSTVIQPGQESRITFVFSAEHDVGQGIPFFGYWQEADFLSFLGSTQQRLAATTPADVVFVTAQDDNGPTAGVGVPATNYAMYTIRQICEAWNVAAYPDATPPPAPAVTLADDTGASDTDRITRVGTLSIDLEADARAEYSRDGGRTWHGRFVPREGFNAVLVRQIDAAGNASAATTFTFVLDMAPPPPVRAVLADDTGRSASDRVTTDGRIAVVGRLPDATLEYSTDGGRRWAAAFAPREGVNVVRVRQIDLAGTPSRPSPTLRFVLDTIALMPTVRLTSDTGPSPSDRITWDGRLTVLGTEPAARVTYSTDGGATWAARVRPVGGRNHVLVRQVDRAGNASPSAGLSFILDRDSGNTTVTARPQGREASGTGVTRRIRR